MSDKSKKKEAWEKVSEEVRDRQQDQADRQISKKIFGQVGDVFNPIKGRTEGGIIPHVEGKLRELSEDEDEADDKDDAEGEDEAENDDEAAGDLPS